MPKHRVVIFLPHTAREETSDDPTSLLHYQNAVLDPDLSKVKGLYPPHFWKLDGSVVVPMTEQEMQERILMLDEAMKKGITFSNTPEKKTLSEVINSIGEFGKRADAIRLAEEKKRMDNVSSIKRARMMRDGMRKAADDAMKADMRAYADSVAKEAAAAEGLKAMGAAMDFARSSIAYNNRQWNKAFILAGSVWVVILLAVYFLG